MNKDDLRQESCLSVLNAQREKNGWLGELAHDALVDRWLAYDGELNRKLVFMMWQLCLRDAYRSINGRRQAPRSLDRDPEAKLAWLAAENATMFSNGKCTAVSGTFVDESDARAALELRGEPSSMPYNAAAFKRASIAESQTNRQPRAQFIEDAQHEIDSYSEEGQLETKFNRRAETAFFDRFQGGEEEFECAENDDDYFGNPESGALEREHCTEAMNQFKSLVEKWPEGKKRVLFLRLQGHSNTEVAQTVGVSASRSSTAFRKALRELEKALERSEA